MTLRLGDFKIFFRDVRQELRGVQWPTRRATVRFTATIIVASAVVAVVAGLVDLGLSSLVERLFLRLP